MTIDLLARARGLFRPDDRVRGARDLGVERDPQAPSTTRPKAAPRGRAVNLGSRFALSTLVLLSMLLPAVASADGILLMPLRGRADQERLEEIEGTITSILANQGHRLVPPTGSILGPNPSSSEMEAAATAANAGYVIVGEVDPLPGQYRLHIYVYYVPNGRLEELVVTVLNSEENERLSDVLSSMVRREGLGEDAIRLTGEEDPIQTEEVPPVEDPEAAARRAAEEAARREAEEAARREAEEAAAREAEEAARRNENATEAWNNRVQYGADAPWMIQIGVGGRYGVSLGTLPTGQGGGGLFDASVRLGRTFEGIDGFEIRARIDFATGVYTGLGVHAGAAWLASPFVEPIYIGLGGEVGAIFTFTGSRDVGFSAQISALFAWRPTDHFYLEASLPELGVVTQGTGAFTIGASLRAGYRF